MCYMKDLMDCVLILQANRECMFEKEPSEQLYAKVEKARKVSED